MIVLLLKIRFSSIILLKQIIIISIVYRICTPTLPLHNVVFGLLDYSEIFFPLAFFSTRSIIMILVHMLIVCSPLSVLADLKLLCGASE